VSVSRADELLAGAAEDPDRLQRHLLVAAALREVLGQEPVVVGGTAEDMYTGETYVQTDLDLCGWVTPEEEQVLFDLNFVHEGRYWRHVPSNVAVEFPESKVHGDEGRFIRKPIGAGLAVIIGVDDFYLDRLRQTTAYPVDPEPTEFKAAVAVAVASYDEIEWSYVEEIIRGTEREDPNLGRAMRATHKRVRRRLLSELKKIGP
jgi:hypothetical protein